MNVESRPSPGHRHSTARVEDGFALIVVLLSTLVIAALIISTLSMTTMGTRTNVTRDAQSFQALLAAETGVNTFISRVKEAGFKGTVGQIDCFVNGYRSTGNGGAACAGGSKGVADNLLLTTSATGPRFTLRVLQTDVNASAIVVQSVGMDGRQAKATVTQQVILNKPPFLNVASPAALTSCPGISGGGGAQLSGMDATSSGKVASFTTITSVSSGTPPTIRVPSNVADILTNGSYFEVNNLRYKISSIESDTDFKITPVGHSTYPAAGSTPVMTLIPMAARSGATLVPGTLPPRYRLPISDPTGVFINDVVYFRSGTTAYALTVKGKGFETAELTSGYIEVELGAAATAAGAYTYDSATGLVTSTVPTPLPGLVTGLSEGTAIWRYIPGGTSAGRISKNNNTYKDSGAVSNDYWGGSSNVTPAAIAGNPVVKCGDQLFAQVFNNITKPAYYDLVPAANRLSAISNTRPLSRDIYWLGPPAGQPGSNFSLGANSLCGSGILVINGNLDMGGTGNIDTALNQCTSQGSTGAPKGFNGLIYVIGNLSNQGNSIINGSVVVEGNVTTLTTSLNGGMNITYDPRAMLSSSRNLSPVTFSLQGSTWGQQ